MNDTLQPDYEMTNLFLDALTGHKDEAVTFQFFDDRDKKKRTASFRHMKRGLVYNFLQKKQREGSGVFVMVNAGDGKGRKKKNVVKVRALFIDLDGSPWEPAATALKPHLRVESSPGRWHLYWLVSDCPPGRFKALQQAIANKYAGDKSCCDLPRVLRVPGFYHLKHEPVMTMMVEANDFPRYTTEQIIAGLGLELATSSKAPMEPPQRQQQKAELPEPLSRAYAYTCPSTGEMVDLAAWAAQNPGFDILKAIKRDYVLGAVVDGKQHIACPFAGEHTDTAPDLATFIANTTPDHSSFTIHCMHSHCAERDRLEFLQVMFRDGWLPVSVLIPEPVKMKRPSKVYIPIDEIHANIEWAILSPEEHRVALHIAELMWSDEHGSIPDDDWLIARSLGMTEEQWRPYRATLTRSGWLHAEGGRLHNSIVKREFDNAQKALMTAIINGKKGGDAKAAKSRVAMG